MLTRAFPRESNAITMNAKLEQANRAESQHPDGISVDFDLPHPEVPLKDHADPKMSFEEQEKIFGSQRAAYLRDFYDPMERLDNKVAERFVWED